MGVHKPRRRFLLVSAVAALVGWTRLLTGPAVANAARAGTDADAPARVLAALFGDSGSLAPLGRVYLRDHPEEADPRRLMHDLGLAGGLPAETVRGRLARRRQRDFADGDLVFLDGWIAARTEARLGALSALAVGRRVS